MAAQLHDAIVMTQPPAQFIRADRPQPSLSDAPVRIGQPAPVAPRGNPADGRAIAETLRSAGAAVVLRTSEGEHGTMFVLGRDQGDAGRTLAGAGRRAVQHDRRACFSGGLPVKIRVQLQTHYTGDDPHSYNVVAEIPGTDPQLGADVVMLGAHLDSWHSATGASDNADGCAAVLEAMRILEALDLRPKRTIRVALWSGEEEGLLGSKAYVEQHLAGDANADARRHLFAYFNIDPATGPIYGWYAEKSEAAKAIFDQWLQPLNGLGARRNVLDGIGATDHLSFRAAGIPGFNPIQEYKDYDVRMHHTNADMYERVSEQDLKQNAIVLAWFAGRRPTPIRSFRVLTHRRVAASQPRGRLRRFARADTMVAAGILASRLSGLVRVVIFSSVFGLRSDAADAFYAAVKIPNLLQNLFGEGALSGSFIPVHAGLRAQGRDEEAAQVGRGRSSRCSCWRWRCWCSPACS